MKLTKEETALLKNSDYYFTQSPAKEVKGLWTAMADIDADIPKMDWEKLGEKYVKDNFSVNQLNGKTYYIRTATPWIDPFESLS